MSTTATNNTVNRLQPHVAASARRAVRAAVGFAAASLLWTNAHAQDSPPQRSVDFADLNLSVPADANTLYRRLRAAAKEVCGADGGKDLRRLRQHDVCYHEALSAAVAQVDHAAITARHQNGRNSQLAGRASDATPRS